ncbi:ArsR/SmtB family transcription factor [Frateuria aurantia]
MRPFIHPPIDDITVQGILHALSDPVRAIIFTSLAKAEQATPCCQFLQVTDRNIPKSTLSQHFRVLREAGLVHSERRGVEVHNNSRCKDIEQRFPGLLQAILQAYQRQWGTCGDT